MIEAQGVALHGELVTDNRTTLEEFAERWLRAVRVSLEPAGHTSYRITLALYALPRLGHVMLSAFTPLTLSTVYADLLACGGHKGNPLSNTTGGLVHAVLRKALYDAVLWGRCTAPRACARRYPSASAPS